MDKKIIRVRLEDLDGLKQVLDSSELFPSEYLDNMIADYFNNPDTEDIWFTYVADNNYLAIGYCAPEKFTNGTYNLYAIAVKKEFQGKGIGGEMMRYIETLLKNIQKRVLIVETSSNDQYKLTRDFYLKLGYRKEATIKDFWSEGEDKVVFWKKLN